MADDGNNKENSYQFRNPPTSHPILETDLMNERLRAKALEDEGILMERDLKALSERLRQSENEREMLVD
jgi:hypothetical protein